MGLQVDALERAGVERIFSETISGTRTDRPELNAALAYARPGDVLVVGIPSLGSDGMCASFSKSWTTSTNARSACGR
ncbi:recombinase family protein [Caulobacter segnis]